MNIEEANIETREIEQQTRELRLTVEIPTELSAGAQPVCQCVMCCNGPHSGPP